MSYRSISLFFAATLLAGAVHAAPASSHAVPAQLQQAAGEYNLPNGRQVSLRVANGRLFALLGQRERRELMANGDGSFATADRTLSLRFREASEGTQIVLSVPRQSAMTGNRGLRQMAALGEVQHGAEPALAQVVTESIEDRQLAAVGAPR